MRLLIDIGNTLCKVALAEEKSISEALSFPFSVQKIEALLEKEDVQKIAFSTVKSHSPEETKFFTKSGMTGVKDFAHFPFINKYESKETLGDDRIAAVCGAYSMRKKSGAMLIIQAGTAFTFDYLNENNEYLGGAISPGIELRFKALHNFTGNLPLIEKTINFDAIGTSTKDSISGGVMMGSLAEIQYRIDLFHNQFPEGEIFITGGNASYFVSSLKNDIFAAENLVLHGLNYLLNLNS